MDAVPVTLGQEFADDGPVDAVGFSLGAITLLELAISRRALRASRRRRHRREHLRRRPRAAPGHHGRRRGQRAPTTTWVRQFAHYANQRGNDPSGARRGSRRTVERRSKERLAASRSGARLPRRQGLRRARRSADGSAPRRPPGHVEGRRPLRHARIVRLHRRRLVSWTPCRDAGGAAPCRSPRIDAAIGRCTPAAWSPFPPRPSTGSAPTPPRLPPWPASSRPRAGRWGIPVIVHLRRGGGPLDESRP